MPTAEESACPACGAPGTLSLSQVWQARPFGSVALAGVQLKTEMRLRPVLSCSACGLSVHGEFDPDGRHVMFRNK